ncbi:MAG TPA: MFS transporter [Anaerolineae bacterium]|nr:MFS transporter [Anaerolineae bacterium]HQK12458.1 MFS transporter [Anaerolineae bacterium]
MTAGTTDTLKSKSVVRSRNYLIFLVIFMGWVALLDQYISMIKTTAIPYIIEAYDITASDFSWYEALYLATTFLIFLLNGLNDIIGRKYSILVLVLMMGLSSLGVVLFTPTLHLFMVFYTIAMFTTVSNMWSIPVSEEAPADKRAKYVAIVYVIGLLPLQAILPPLLMNVLGLSWKWMYGVVFVLMLPALAMWFFMRETGRYEVVKGERRAGTRKNHFFGLGVINRQDVRYIIIASAVWLCWLIYQFLYFWAGYYFMTLHGYTLGQWSTVLLASLVLAIIGGVSAGAIMDRIGRTPAFVGGCLCLAAILVVLGFGRGWVLPVAAALTGFFTSFTYTWIVVYVPEVFPTERRGACIGWTTTVARVSYVVGPALAAVLLKVFPTMEWFWVVAAGLMLLPIGIILIANPYETKSHELEEIEHKR